MKRLRCYYRCTSCDITLRIPCRISFFTNDLRLSATRYTQPSCTSTRRGLPMLVMSPVFTSKQKRDNPGCNLILPKCFCSVITRSIRLIRCFFRAVANSSFFTLHLSKRWGPVSHLARHRVDEQHVIHIADDPLRVAVLRADRQTEREEVAILRQNTVPFLQSRQSLFR